MSSLPDAITVKSLFDALYGGNTVVKPSKAAAGGGKKQPAAMYVDGDSSPIASIVCDLPLAAYSAAALTRIPVGGAEDAISEGGLSDMMLDNYQEVMNVCGTLIRQSGGRVVLERVYADVGEIADKVDDWSGNRADFAVSVPGYGEGTMSILAS